MTQISIDVQPRYIEAESDPDQQRFVFAYTITIANQGSSPARLLNRRWLITDADGGVEEVKGAGVVGKPRPRLVRLTQAGLLRTAPDQAYMPATAQQYFQTDAMAFVWRVRVTMARALPIAGRDSFVDGRGRMIIKLGSLVPLAVSAWGSK